MENKKTIKIKDIISTIFIIIVLIVGYKIYRKYNFNEFTKAEHTHGITKFERDSENRLSDYDSYKINNEDYNDAMFFKTVTVVPNTSYKVSCKIKTENVEGTKRNSDSGAHICIADTSEKSNNVKDTSDWTDISFYFNSKNRTQVDVGFRLGGIEDNCKRYSMVFRF